LAENTAGLRVACKYSTERAAEPIATRMARERCA